MPLTISGQKILKSYRKRYGKIKGRGFFYATIRKYPKRTKSWERKRRIGLGKRRRRRK